MTWDVNDLPPVGSKAIFETDINTGEDWHKDIRSGIPVEIIAHFDAGAQMVAAFIFDAYSCGYGKQVAQATADCFKPVPLES